jgi:hypothetical protein
MDAPAAARAEGLFFDIGEEGFFLEGLLVFLLDRVRRSKDPVDDQAREAEE